MMAFGAHPAARCHPLIGRICRPVRGSSGRVSARDRMSALQLACHVLVQVDELRMWDNSAADCAHVLTFGTERWRPQAQALVQANHRDLAFPPWPAQVVIELRC